MSSSRSYEPTRGAFVADLARWSALAGLAGMSAHLMTRKRKGAEDCSGATLCDSCGVWATCRLPQRIPNAKTSNPGNANR